MSTAFLQTTSGTYDRAAIMRRAWTRARGLVAWHSKLGMPTTLREAFSGALRQTWDEARSAHSLAAWRAEQDRQAEALAQLDSRTRELAALPLTASTAAPPSAARSARSRRASPP